MYVVDIALHTSLGDLNIELHADQTPMTCDNFVEHCKSGYYDNTTFHRSIPGFMIQGGDPTGTGTPTGIAHRHSPQA